jgi:ubiquinone/menaquinone biosynthesis C-methylase UbiE
MPGEKVDLYDNAYAHYAQDVYRQVRVETYGEDFGQTSWVTTEESNEIPQLLRLQADSSVLEIGCGSGRYALHVAKRIGCRILGLDINASGVQNANRLAQDAGLGLTVRFEVSDVSQNLAFDPATFDAVFANDTLCHIPRRPELLERIFGLLKPGGRLLFSDALVVGGLISHEEIAARSSIGYYVYSPPGENERLIQDAGFTSFKATDTTRSAELIAARWRDSRSRHKEQLIAAEGEAGFEGLQQFLSSVHNLNSERRLLRFVYLARKE